MKNEIEKYKEILRKIPIPPSRKYKTEIVTESQNVDSACLPADKRNVRTVEGTEADWSRGEQIECPATFYVYETEKKELTNRAERLDWIDRLTREEKEAIAVLSNVCPLCGVEGEFCKNRELWDDLCEAHRDLDFMIEYCSIADYEFALKKIRK